jgi:gamma-glutamyltranspeptidase/glutathione hydrolase
MVVSSSRYASETGIEILKRGGNAIDAAVAVGFVLAVTYPQAGNIGGGGFMLIRTKDGRVTAIDYREKAPAAAFPDMFLDEHGNYDPEKALVGHLSAGVPGSVAGMLYALEKYGTMSRADIIEPAISYAKNGFEIEPQFAASLNANRESFSEFPATARIFVKKGGFKPGELFVQKDLANTLELVKFHGRDGFYSGITADLIEREMKLNGGLITKSDLQNYQPVERKPLSTTYRGYEVYSVPPPSSGGICLLELLNMVENDTPEQSLSFYHLLAESMRRVFSDRAEYMGDPEFYDVPVQDLISKNYAKERRKQITDSASKSADIKPGLYSYYKESDQTTHYSVIDKEGNMVSVTTTLNNSYGSYVVVDGAGFLLNDEMDDFVSKTGVPNMFGLIGSEANSIQPNKRMLSSMTPTIILKDNQPFMILGSPGGGKIITTVFLTILNVIDFGLPLDEAIDKPRFHHQLYPDCIQYEAGAFSDEITSNLISKGHVLKQVADYGSVNAILVDWQNRAYFGHSDRRGYGKAVGY